MLELQLSTLFLVVVLIANKTYAATQSSGLSLFACSFLLAAIFLFFGYWSKERKLNTSSIFSLKDSVLVLWSLSILLSYSSFIIFPEKIYPHHLLMARCFAPVLAVLFVETTKTLVISRLQKLLITLALILLTAIFISVFLESSTPFFSEVLIVCILFIFQTTGQSCARISAKIGSPYGQSMKLSLLNSIGFFGLAFLFSNEVPALPSKIGLILTGLSIIFIYYFTISGIKKISPILSAFFISTGVPVTIIAEHLLFEHPYSAFGLGSSYLYLALSAAILSYRFLNKPAHTSQI